MNFSMSLVSVNNVGMAYEFPEFFNLLDDKVRLIVNTIPSFCVIITVVILLLHIVVSTSEHFLENVTSL